MTRRAGEKKAPVAPPAERCDCGGFVLSSGKCDKTGDYPLTAVCPFVCPYCRGAVSWRGWCDRCWGRKTSEGPMTFPGDRYEVHGGHWVLTLKGPRPACTPEENHGALGVVRAVLGQEIDVATALGMLDEVFVGGLVWDDAEEPGSRG